MSPIYSVALGLLETNWGTKGKPFLQKRDTKAIMKSNTLLK